MIKVSLTVFIFSLCLFISCYPSRRENPAQNLTHIHKTKRLFLAIDGLDRKYFDYAQKSLGLFKPFKSISTHIAPFPSISDYAWNKVVQAKKVYGHKGRIQNYEAAFYDHSANRVITDPREYFRRIGQHQHYYNGAFDVFLNPYIESFLYIPTEELPKLELETLSTEILKRISEPQTSALVASMDALSHTRAGIDTFTKDLDAFLNSLIKKHKAKGKDLEIILISDHGQAFDFQLGSEPQQLKTADLFKAARLSNFSIKKQLTGARDIAIPIMALGNYASVFFKDINLREEFSLKMKRFPWFSQAIYLAKRQEELATVNIHDQQGHAELKIVYQNNKPLKYFYQPISSNPLRIPADISEKWLDDGESLKRLAQNPFPDSLYRIAQAASEDEAELPDLLLTLKDEFRVKGELDQFAKMYRTHGSLSALSSNGIVASNMQHRWPQVVRSDDILQMLDLHAKDLFKQNIQKTHSKIIYTGARNFSPKRVFGLINNLVNDSQYVLDNQSIILLRDTVANLLKKPLSSKKKTLPTISEIEIITTKELAQVLDLAIKHKNWDKILVDSDFQNLKKKIKERIGQLNSNLDISAHSHHHPHSTNALKTYVMKQHSLPFLINRALSFPEFSEIKDPRNSNFSKKHHRIYQKITDFKYYKKHTNYPSQLFQEVFKEKKLEERISPEPLEKYYKMKTELSHTTFVYIPGIYNSIFNNEIFKKGLDSIKNDLGARVIQAPTLSVCDSEYNSHIILEFIKNDIKYRQDRSKPQHKYFVMGYSKGAVDALYAFKNDPDFTRKHVQGLISIASPLQGSSIVERADLPLTLLEMLGNEEIPEVCQQERWASKTITPHATQDFFEKHGKNLIDLTRYFSVSFTSDIADSHIWMKATKQIAGFKEKNDGIVSLSHSKFPKDFFAIDFGTVKADHLAGIVASDFPQAAFMKSLVISLDHVGAFQSSSNWLAQTRYQSNYITADQHQNFFEKLLSFDFDFKKEYSPDELHKMEKTIKKRLTKTPYRVRDFRIIKGLMGGYFIEFAPHPVKSAFNWFMADHFIRIPIDSKRKLLKILLSKMQQTGKDLLKNNHFWRAFPRSNRKPFRLPASNIDWKPHFRIKLLNVTELLGNKKIQPITQTSHPAGVSIIYDHQTPSLFRDEYKFFYETTTSPQPDNNFKSGWVSQLDNNELVAKLSSQNSSVRLTTYSFRFMASDYPNMKLKIKVTDNVKGANVLAGGSGDDDSAFQLWFNVRVNKQGINRAKFYPNLPVKVFGYYWGDTIEGNSLADGEIYENYYSNMNFLVTKLPEAKQLLLAHKRKDLGRYIEFKRNILNDLKRAFPDVDPQDLEIIGITIQQDSDNTGDNSEAYFKYLKFET